MSNFPLPKKEALALFILFSSMILLSANPSDVNPAAPKATFTADQGWVNLIDGHDLSAWFQPEGDAKFTLENGVLTGTTNPNTNNNLICTKKEYGNFILELDVKIDTTLNSGIQIRSHSDKNFKKGAVYGYEIEIDPSKRAWSGGIYDSRRRGWLVNLKHQPIAQKAFKNGLWNHYRIKAIGDTIETWINHVPVATLLDSMDSRGMIGFQLHQHADSAGLKVQFRNVRIKTFE